jgi:hypothetical protein
MGVRAEPTNINGHLKHFKPAPLHAHLQNSPHNAHGLLLAACHCCVATPP